MAYDASILESWANGQNGLSTAQVAGLIALGLFIVNLLFNLAWPVITVALLTEQESAVTWSVASRMIHNSYWPTILQSDASATKGVRSSVVWQSYIMLLAAILVSLASIITPLGLYETVLAAKAPKVERFVYLHDDYSALGLGTAPRHPAGFNRICGSMLPINCPGAINNLTTTKNETKASVDTDTFYDISIPEKYMSFWSRGVSKFSQSVSSLFDIEYRTYGYTTDTLNHFFNNGSGYLVGSYRTMTTVILNDAMEPVEGLIVDTKNGGVGFRNHSAPAEKPQWGVRWTEDILFIEPVTECANMNLTLEFDVRGSSALNSLQAGNLSIRDNGGFADINQTYPYYIPETAQDDPELAYRAYKGAWSSNVWTMLYMNITNPGPSLSGMKSFSYLTSEKGQLHNLPVSNFTNASSAVNANSIFTGKFAQYIQDIPSSNYSNGGKPSVYNFTSSTRYQPVNPWQITSANFSSMRLLCQGALGGDKANISNVAGQCGLVMGMPYRKDGNPTVLFEPSTKYEVPLYNCASATRAIIKTVTFTYNSTVGLRGLKVLNIEPKNYSDPSQMPLWAVEKTNETLSSLIPLWGLVDKEDASFPNVSYKRSPHLWLTGSAGLGSIAYASMNLPGVEFPGNALNAAYNVDPSSSNMNGLSDYSGKSSLPLYNRWKDLTRTTAGSAKVINLIWTDLAANAVVGTKSWVSGYNPASKPIKKRDNKGSNDSSMVPVIPYSRVVRYKMQFAIPAFILLALLVSALIAACMMAITRRTSIKRISAYLERLSAGRVMTALLERQQGYSSAGGSSVELVGARSISKGQKSSKWIKQHGRTRIDIAGEAPRMAGYNTHEMSNEPEPRDTTAMLEKTPPSPDVHPTNAYHHGSQ